MFLLHVIWNERLENLRFPGDIKSKQRETITILCKLGYQQGLWWSKEQNLLKATMEGESYHIKTLRRDRLYKISISCNFHFIVMKNKQTAFWISVLTVGVVCKIIKLGKFRYNIIY